MAPSKVAFLLPPGGRGRGPGEAQLRHRHNLSPGQEDHLLQTPHPPNPPTPHAWLDAHLGCLMTIWRGVSFGGSQAASGRKPEEGAGHLDPDASQGSPWEWRQKSDMAPLCSKGHFLSHVAVQKRVPLKNI